MTVVQRPWWKEGTVYQIYPASFKDSNGDGWGDLPGIISKIPYLKDLGIDIVWISPMYESPQFDMGYDISNYEGVHAPYGTVEDMEILIQECHSRGIRLILDLVINHTSHEHQWFQESKSSKDNPKRDWYIWRPARYDADGKRWPPNNWQSIFQGSAWEWDEGTEEYYLHLFAPEQPDLNWESEVCREAIYDSAMRFWLDKGVDGFRVDTVNMYSKGSDMPDAPIVDKGSFYQRASGLFCNGPRMHEFLREMNTKVLDHYDAMTVGELPHTPDPAHVLRYIGSDDKQLNMVFQFDIVDLGCGASSKYDYQGFTLPQLKAVVSKWQRFIAGTTGWTTAFCENHDQGRSVSRFASDAPAHRAAAAKLLAVMLASLTGTLFLYQGQEIGMVNIPRDWPLSDLKDIESINYYNAVAARTGNDPAALARARDAIGVVGRDNARTPMQWDDSPNAGFSIPGAQTEPWLRVHDLYREINVAQQQRDPGSVLAFWRRMLRLRKEHRDLFIYGAFEAFEMEDERLFVFAKRTAAAGGKKTSVTVLNFTGEEQVFRRPEAVKGGRWRLLVGNFEGGRDGEAEVDGTEVRLKPYEGRVYLVS